MVPLDENPMIVLIEAELGKAPRIYSAAEVKPYVEDLEEVTTNFMSSLGKAIINKRDVIDGCAQYSYSSDCSEPNTNRLKSNAEYSRSSKNSSVIQNSDFLTRRPTI